MAVYKVPQDVEADDKLIGPFSFRQFIYLVIVAGGIALGWVLGQVFLPLAAIPLPIIIFFGALALPLRKDQPMETYLAAIISFYLKPRQRLWDSDGIESLIEITAPKVVEVQRTKGVSQEEAEQRLSYLANIVDTQGWAIRDVNNPQNTAVNADVYNEAQQVEDILEVNSRTANLISAQLSQTDQRHKQALIANMQNPQQAAQPAQAPAQTTVTAPVVAQPIPAPSIQTGFATAQASSSEPKLTLNPYPAMHQAVIRPLGDQPVQPVAAKPAPQKPVEPSKEQPSPDIINLANNSDLSIATIANEANRIKKKQLPEDEVVISLR